jgi:ribA/ribD-fused uncharacterized protein
MKPEAMSGERFTFFFTADSHFSQWYPRSFSGAPLFGDKTDEPMTFQNCEQWMMYNKALLFQDKATAEEILTLESPKECKAAGRRVRNFNERIWKENNETIIYEGNRLKLTHNPDLLQKLKDTGGTTLVEASPFDRIYGIGLRAMDPRAQSRSTWRGQNLLGETLTRLRKDLG